MIREGRYGWSTIERRMHALGIVIISKGIELALQIGGVPEKDRVKEFATDRFRNGEYIATGFVESTVNQVVSKRFVKHQSMRWKERGAHLLLQVRTKTLNDELRLTFEDWYPGLKETA